MTLFNADYYLDRNPDVAEAGVDAQLHYRLYGAREAYELGAATRAPAPWFDIVHYLDTHADLAQAFGDDPGAAFDHFVLYGLAEGRSPSAGLKAGPAGLSAYAAANPDLQQAFGILNPGSLTDAQQVQLLTHFYAYGWYEDRPGSPFGDYVDAVLTTNPDSPALGDTADHLIDAPLLRDSSGQWQQSLNAYDTIIAGDGFDVLRAVLNGVDGAPGGFYDPVIRGVEEYHLSVDDNAQHTDADGMPVRGALLNLARASGYELIRHDATGSDLYIINANAQAAVPAIELVLPDMSGMGIVVPNVTWIDYVGAPAGGITQRVTAGVADGGEYGVHVLGITGAEVNTLDLTLLGDVGLVLEGAAGRMVTFRLQGGSSEDFVRYNLDSDRLETVDAAGYRGDVMLTIMSSPDLAELSTGPGDDWVELPASAIHNGFHADLGAGENALVLMFPEVVGDEPDDRHIDAALLGDLDFTGGFHGVGTLELSGYGFESFFLFDEEDVVLDLAGMDDALETIHLGNVDSLGYTLTLKNVPGDTLSLVTGISHMFLDVPDLDGTLTLVSEQGMLSLGVAQPGPPFMGGLVAPHVETLDIVLEGEEEMGGFAIIGLSSHGEALHSLSEITVGGIGHTSVLLKLQSSIPFPDRPDGHFGALEHIDLSGAGSFVMLDAASALYAASTVTYELSLNPGRVTAEDKKANGTAEIFRFHDGDIPGSMGIENFWMGQTGLEANRDVLDLRALTADKVSIAQGNFSGSLIQGYDSDLLIQFGEQGDPDWASITLLRVLDTEGRDGRADHTIAEFIAANTLSNWDFWEEVDMDGAGGGVVPIGPGVL
ncbi:MAG: hypothetical protein WCY98_10350 [Castellaniella sp.]